MKKILFVFAFLALGLTLKSECPPEADDFAFTDCRGVEFTLYDILDGGQTVLMSLVSRKFIIVMAAMAEICL